MSVVHRERPADSPYPVRSAALEDILRDAACFTTKDEAPKGLAHRALARQIASQTAHENVPSVRANRKQSVVFWFGGLSAGTLAGAAAALLIIAHLNGNAFRITPETASLPIQKPEANGIHSFAPIAAPAGRENLPGPPQRAALATLTVADKLSEKKPRPSERRFLEQDIPARLLEGYRRKERDYVSEPRSRSVASRAASPAVTHAAPPVARWKTEPFEETEYQLVTADYTPEPTSGGYTSGSDHLQLTPLKMRASFDASESNPMAGPSLPQY